MLRLLRQISICLACIQFVAPCPAEDEYQQLQEVPGHSYYSLCYAPDGSLIAAVGHHKADRGRQRRGQVTIWNTRTGKVVFREGDIPCWMGDVHFSPDGELLAVTCTDRSVWVYRRAFDRRRNVHWQKIKRLPQVAARPQDPPDLRLDQVRFSPDGALLAASNQAFRGCAGRDPARCVQIWSTEDFSEIGVLRGPLRHTTSLQFLPDGKQLVVGYCSVGSSVPELPIWDVESEAVARELRLEEAETKPLQQTQHPVTHISPDGKLLAVGAYGYLALIEAESLEVRRRLDGHKKQVRSVNFSPTQPLLASGGEDETMRVWNIETGEQLALRERDHWWTPTSLQFSPDGKMLAAIAAFETPRLWDVSRLIEKP